MDRKEKPCTHPEHWTCLPQRHGSVQFHERLKELGELHNRKQSDYGQPDDPFANIRASERWGVPGWVGALVRAGDKMARLQTAVSRGHLANESIRDSLLDLAVYAIIALTIYDGEIECLPGKSVTPDAGPVEELPAVSGWVPWRNLSAKPVDFGGGEYKKTVPPPIMWWDDA